MIRDTQWGVFRTLREVVDQRQDAAANVLEGLAQALSHDEHVKPLKDALVELAQQALQVLARSVPAPAPVAPPPGQPATPAPMPPEPSPSGGPGLVVVEEDSRTSLSAPDALGVLDELRAKLEDEDGMELTLSWRLQRRKPN